MTRSELDLVLLKLCKMITTGQQKDPNYYGMVGACVIDSAGNKVASTSTKEEDKWHHAERNALEKYKNLHGEVPQDAVIVTTLSPCNSPMTDRDGNSCTDVINYANIKRVYCGYKDPTQDNHTEEFTIIKTHNPEIEAVCKELSDTFLKENFADGKKPGRKGLAKRSGVNCKQSVSKLRSIAAHSTGEKQRMAHWCANMKSGKKK
jgi:pyrimidine deaminase RibD-like protein